VKRIAVEWESYETPSYGLDQRKEKIGIVGGLGVVSDEVLQRISRALDITAIGMPSLRGESLPVYEELDGYRVIRPVYSLPLSSAVERCSRLFQLAGMEFTGTHMRELQYLPFIREYSLAIAGVRTRSPPEVICAHDWMAILGGFEKSRELKAPYVVFLHSLESGRVAGMVHTPLGPREARPLGVYAGSRMIRDIEVIGLKECDVCFTVGKTMVEEVKLVGRSHGVPEERMEGKVYPIHHGVDTKVYRPMRNVEKEYDVIFIGRFAIVKGILELLDAIKIVKPLLPDIKVKLIGGGELEADIMAKIREGYLEENVSVSTTWYQKEDKAVEINKAKVAVAPSKYEPHGQVDLEAGACGVPTIVGTGGFMERVIPGVTALQCDPFSPRDIAEKIHILLKDDALREEMGGNARELIKRHYDWDERARVYPRLFEIVLSGDISELADLPLTVELEGGEHA